VTLERPKVLVVDDAPSNLHILCRGLGKDFQCETASNGRAALEKIKADPPDLVLLDILMPGMNGYEVCRRLKADKATRSIPVIFLTALDDADEEAKGLELGAVDYVTKPFRIPIVQARVRNHVEMKRHRDLLERHALIDALTGIPNRRNFEEALSKEWRRSSRQHASLALIIADIDYFKNYNDHYGHRAGDICLRQVAQAIASAVKRPSDIVARYGGEEFAVILPSTEIEGALVVAHAIQNAVNSLKLPHCCSDVGECLSVSQGLAAMIPDSKEEPHAIIEAADKALYKAKKGGRNRLITA
jgi:diguanylate cyclase (GGDEF)-like protein